MSDDMACRNEAARGPIGRHGQWLNRRGTGNRGTRRHHSPLGCRAHSRATHSRDAHRLPVGSAAFQGGITQGQARAMRILQRILMDDDLPDVDALDELLGDG